jgi:hypothetical protein
MNGVSFKIQKEAEQGPLKTPGKKWEKKAHTNKLQRCRI